MRRNNILTGLILLAASQALHATGFVATVEQIKGVVLVDQGSSYVTAEAGHGLKANDRVFVLNGGVAEVHFANGCAIKVDQNTILTIKSAQACSTAAGNAKFVAPQYAAALGAVEPTAPSKEPEVLKDAAPGSTVIGGVSEWEKPAAAAKTDIPPVPKLETAQSSPTLLASLGPKLAIPVTLTGAVLFSALAGGGGERGNDASPQ